ncbi:MAG: DNA-processing protein DprA [Rickettsiales bacterium]|nr:DNA-processing protein DprA [Rickettsiales bacterium]
MQKFYQKEFCSNENQVRVFQLSRTRNIGPITFLSLIKKYKNPQNALEKITDILKSKGLTKDIISKSQAEDEIALIQKNNAKFITIFDEEYPSLLAEIYDPPIIISYKGDWQITKNKSIGVVGARNASANGLGFTYKISTDLVKQNFVVTSGLAKGIDASAHKASLENNGKTIAVIAGGIDNIYPKENAKLYTEIAEKGLIISENPFGSLPKSESFPRRNRIISGLSLGVLVVEAVMKSGSLITARFANEQGREVFCVPGFPLDARSEGPNNLIKKGANLVTSAFDICDILKDFSEENILNKIQNNLLFDVENYSFETEILNNNSEEKEEIIDENDEAKPSQNQDYSEMILDYLSSSPIEIDEIFRKFQIPASKINSIILELEITGQINRQPGNRIVKNLV